MTDGSSTGIGVEFGIMLNKAALTAFPQND
jgi:hypothetical protein